VLGQDEDVAEVGEHRAVGHHAGEPHLLTAGRVEPERHRVRDRPLHHVTGDARRPVRGHEEPVDDVEVQSRGIGVDLVAVLATHQASPS
jgi:hypothetical protein